MADKVRIPLHALLDQCLGFSLKDLVLKTQEEKAEFGRKLDKALAEALAREVKAREEARNK